MTAPLGEVRLINVPAPSQVTRLDEYSADDWRTAVAGVLEDVIVQLQGAVESLVETGGGVALLVVPAVQGDGAWRTSVAGLHGLVRAVAKEYGRMGVRCNMMVGESAELERLLTQNTAITGEMLVVGDGVWGASGLERL